MQHHESACANTWKFPCARLVIGSRAVSCWRLTGAVGLVCGSIVSMAAGSESGLSPLSMLSLHFVVCALCVGYALVRRKVVGAETHTLLEILAVALAAMLSISWLSGVSTLVYLDATITGIGVLVAIGRIGCFSVGCCYGVKADIGLVYPHECGGDGRTRRFPVQLLDAAVWLLLACVGWTLVGSAAPGLPLATVLLGYGVARFAIEHLRGDRRPRWRGRSLSQWLSLVAIAGGGLLGQHIQGWSVGIGALLATGLVAWLSMARMSAKWLDPEPALERLGELDSLVSMWSASRPRQISTARVGPYMIGGLCTEPANVWSLSLSSNEGRCTSAEARLVLGALAERLGCGLEGATIRRSRAGVYLWQEAETTRGADPRPTTNAW